MKKSITKNELEYNPYIVLDASTYTPPITPEETQLINAKAEQNLLHQQQDDLILRLKEVTQQLDPLTNKDFTDVIGANVRRRKVKY